MTSLMDYMRSTARDVQPLSVALYLSYTRPVSTVRLDAWQPVTGGFML